MVSPRNEVTEKNSILIASQYPNQATAFDCLKQISLAARRITSTNPEISMKFLRSFPQTISRGETVVGFRNVVCFLKLRFLEEGLGVFILIIYL